MTGVQTCALPIWSNGGFLKSRSVIFTLNGGFSTRKCVNLRIMGCFEEIMHDFGVNAGFSKTKGKIFG